MVEEICRFVLEDPELALRLKKLRSDVGRNIRLSEYLPAGRHGQQENKLKIGKTELIRERKALEDVGREIYTRDEGKRKDFSSIFHANMKRAQEAVRCLEEFSKLISPKCGRAFKKIRFELYEMEKRIAPRINKTSQLDFDLYVVTDPSKDPIKTVRGAVAGGVRIVQFRDKGISKDQYLRSAGKIASITKRAGIALILNDHWDLVSKVGADGVHIGQGDLKKTSVSRIRKSIGEDKIIGVSAANLKQALRAEKQGADYIGAGPVFPTPIKPGVNALGLAALQKMVKKIKIPVVAIGGINRSNIERVKATGCGRVAVIRAAGKLLAKK